MINSDSRYKAIIISDLAQEKMAEDIRVLDMREVSDFCDYFVVTGAASFKQVAAIADHIIDGLVVYGIKPLHSEGRRDSNWVILDYSDVVVHIFYESTRYFYDLERLWGDAAGVVTNTLK
jgi:ribosome-associated protein